jgi:ABC-type hemin transport system substrate-binding protein
MNKCEKCGRVFDCKGSLKKHMNRKIPCIITNQAKSSRFKCESCNRCFTTNQSLKHHIENTCQIIKNKKNAEDVSARVHTEIAELKETVNQLKAKLETQLTHQAVSKQTKINGNQNNNNTIINNYHVNNIMIPYGQDRVKECTILNSFLKEIK